MFAEIYGYMRRDSSQKSGRTDVTREDSHTGREMSIHAERCITHTCATCKLEWPMPRAIKWEQPLPPNGLNQISPSTLDTLIVNQTFDKNGVPHIPAEVFQNFTFADEPRKAKATTLFDRCSPGDTGGCGLVTESKTSHCEVNEESTSPLPSFFTSSGTGSRNLVEGVFYKSNTFIQSENGYDEGYLRLVTLNNWYCLLF